MRENESGARLDEWILGFGHALSLVGATLIVVGAMPASGGITDIQRIDSIDLPDDLVASAEELLEQFRSTDGDRLRTLDFVGTLCNTLNCGRLTEEKASKLLKIHFDALEADAQKSGEIREFVIKVLGGLLSCAAIVISYLGYRHSKATNRG